MLDTLELEKYLKNVSDLPALFNHFGRYFYAMKKLKIGKEDTVIDASCGQGYGSYNIAMKSKYTYGLDINKDYIDYARKNKFHYNLEFLLYDEFFEKNINVTKIVCLETIEHITIYNIEMFLDKLISRLSPNGEIILSFPLGDNKPSKYNPFHLCEPSIDFVLNILKTKLSKINFEIDTCINNYGFECAYCFCWGIK